MNRINAAMYEAYAPKLNPLIMQGLACSYIPQCEQYIAQVFRSAFDGLIDGPSGKLEYVDFARCTPQEEYEVQTKAKNNRRTFDLAKSDIYMCKFILKFDGQLLPPQYLYLPYVGPGGTIRIGGSMFHIAPVLSDKVISPGPKSIFVRLLQYKLNFYRAGHSIIVNGEREAALVVWSTIYNQNKENRKVPATTKAFTALVHYILAAEGFTRAFQKYVGTVPVVGTSKDITTEKYDPSAWLIVESAHQNYKPNTFIGSYYAGSEIRLAIPKEQWTPAMQAFVAGFFYVVDHFPDQMKAEYVDNTQTWMILLGYILFSSHYTVGNLHGRIKEHFVSLDSYVDSIAVEKLAEKGYAIRDFYDLLALLATQYNELCTDNRQSNSMYGKYLDVLYYAMLPVTTAIFTTKFALMKMASKSIPQYGNVKDTLVRKLKPGPIFKLTSDNPVTETVSYSGDHMYFKLTSKVTEQESGPSGRKGKSTGRKTLGEERYLNASMIEGGSILFLSKSNPTPTNRVNCYAEIDPATGTILANPALAALLEATDEQLAQKAGK